MKLFVAFLTLVTQVAVASHLPALHDEPVTACQDGATHFCDEATRHETSPCVLCQVVVNGLAFVPIGIVDAPLRDDPMALLSRSGVPPAFDLFLHSPRGPPTPQ
jgi:hypothetical protein